jgi:Helix-turn-helix domain
MSAIISGDVWRLKLPATDKLVLLKLAYEAWDDGSNANPVIAEIADMCSLNERTVRRILECLEANGLIAKEKPADRPRHLPATYRVIVEHGEVLPRLIRPGTAPGRNQASTSYSTGHSAQSRPGTAPGPHTWK